MLFRSSTRIVLFMCFYLQVSKEDCLSPGNAARLNKKAIKRRGREERTDVKTRRIQFDNGGGSTQYQQIVQEGATSEKDVGLCHCSDVERVSPPIPAPLLETVSSIDSAIKIVFDVETTGLGNYIIFLAFQSIYFTLQKESLFEGKQFIWMVLTVCPFNRK